MPPISRFLAVAFLAVLTFASAPIVHADLVAHYAFDEAPGSGPTVEDDVLDAVAAV